MQTASPRPSGSAPHMPQSTKSDVDVEVKEPLGTTSIDNEDDHKRMPTHPLLQVKDAPSRHGSATYRQIGVRGNEVPIAGPSASVLQMTSKAKPSESKQSLHVQQMMRCAANIDTRCCQCAVKNVLNCYVFSLASPVFDGIVAFANSGNKQQILPKVIPAVPKPWPYCWRSCNLIYCQPRWQCFLKSFCSR